MVMVVIVVVVVVTIQHPSPPVHAAVPPVFDRVVTAAVEAAGYLCPTLPHFSYQTLDHRPFLWRDRVVVERRFEVLVEALAALFWRAGTD